MGGYDKRPEFRPNKRARLERPKAKASFSGAGQGTWEAVTPGNIWAEVRDPLPSRGEGLADGQPAAKRPARIRIRYRAGTDAKMRFVIDGRILQIVGGPAEIGRRYLLEFTVEEYSPAGNPA
ncbi:phage head closure protein [Sphingomonas sp.]|uniref:phage head closure protein n=1 Tax=Sphingomonas sp. TaxID=28214 RepID=UPI0031D320C8